MRDSTPFHRDVAARFGLVPNFFMSASDAPEIVEKLWEFAGSAYLDNPMPSLFKERLFVFLSRFCPVRYCIVRHCGFLVGYGHSSGDAAASPQTVDQAIKLLKAPSPWRRELGPVYERLAKIKQIDWPEPDSDIEDCVFAAAAVIFVEPTRSETRAAGVATGPWRQSLRIFAGASGLHQGSALLDRGAPRPCDRGRHEGTHGRAQGTRLIAPAGSLTR